MARPDPLPNSLPSHIVGSRPGRFGQWMKIFCANCGADGGFIPETGPHFAFYLCTPCSEKWSPLVGTMMIPDGVFWERAADEQRKEEEVPTQDPSAAGKD